jgi:hypothetical protein
MRYDDSPWELIGGVIHILEAQLMAVDDEINVFRKTC